MAEQTPGPFDVTTIKRLIRLMEKFDLSQVDLQEGSSRIRLRRGRPLSQAVPGPMMVAPPMPTAPVAVPSSAAPASVPPPAAPVKPLHEIKSPIVGTFYAKPAPDKDDYVKVGSRITHDTIVCKLEAMKIFNDIAAECTGTIAEVCVKNGQPVEFETVLFRVELS